MFDGNSDLVQSYNQFMCLLGHRYKFYVKNNVLYGINIDESKKIILARKMQTNNEYFPIENIVGFEIIKFICSEYNKKSEHNISIASFAREVLSSLGYNKKYSQY